MIKRTYNTSSLATVLAGYARRKTADHADNTLWIGPESDVPDGLKPHCIVQFDSADETVAFLQARPYIKKVYCMPDVCDAQLLKALYRHTQDAHIGLYFVPKHIDAIGKRMNLCTKDGITLLSVRQDPLQKTGNRLAKRTFDVVVSTLLLLTLFPFFTFVATLFIKLQSRGPVFIKRKFLSTDGRLIECFAFRTTHIKHLRHLSEGTETRMPFPFGNLLRHSGMENMPRLIHIFQGRLSFVGSRMYAADRPNPHHIAMAESPVRYWYKPGVFNPLPPRNQRRPTDETDDLRTGLAADIGYLQNWNAWTDLRILLTRPWKALF